MTGNNLHLTTMARALERESVKGVCIFSLQWILTHQQVNVALRGIATQSSLYTNNYYPPFAIDGNRNSDMSSGSCAHTSTQTDPWWRVDLLAVYDIIMVTVTNRGDCCPERINGAEIHIGNSSINNGNNNPSCAVISSIPAGASVNYTCNMYGRYVNIIIPGPNHVLSLCEVEAYGVQYYTKRAFLKLKFNSSEDLSNPTIWEEVNQKVCIKSVQPSVFQIRWTVGPEIKNVENSQRSMLLFLGMYIFLMQWILTHQQVNVALGGIATQSSTYLQRYASFATDGNRATNVNSNSCTTTNAEYNPWWRVDLLAVYDISNVIITNRGDCCTTRLNGGEIHIGSSLVNSGNNNSRCVVISSIPAGASANYTCNMRGRYVNIILPYVTQYLTLCEVEVYGVAVPVIKRAFLRIKFNSTEDLNNPTMRDNVLQKVTMTNREQ
ncbi:uncharacterized protein LOC113640480 [Tachysurus fulvidraco]|uniref:uncharacterized protein LOC113640480 n=1 Tax=Tachysurus fulvidraco TaxID=1234273 RepID=UPI001FEED3CA|nr:uncharacterized protein LOC113640480 [Tachysurus fulvidraco]